MAGPFANLIDAQGKRVVATVTPSGLLAIITSTPEDGIKSGHPCLNRANVVELKNACVEYLARQP